ncbi:hypothetical protein [Spirillospora sp. CA-294931]|uniref:hypothetical protein n=1 Tax=Spirillospora sp. CA-294931 TaxID=3240042 RepID=UPI003D94A14E
MTTAAREAADQLVRLMRLLLPEEEPPAAVPPARTLRHNSAELDGHEQHVFGLIIRGRRNDRLAEVLDLPVEAIEQHLQALLRDFERPPAPARVERPPHEPTTEPARPRALRPFRRRRAALLASVTGTLMLGAAVPLTLPGERPGRPRATPPFDALSPLAAYGVGRRSYAREAFAPLRKRARHFPTGIATATSFWDPATARGARMSYDTLASPYWPLGTRVRVTYRDRSTVGVVEDFGPADWAIAQHDVPAIIDLSERMMADLTGSREHAVRIRFEVLAWGRGEVYRTSGPGYDLATGAP